MTPYRQPIKPGMIGRDVLAVKRALQRMGVKGASSLVLNQAAGISFVTCLKTVQRAHGITPTGLYGPKTHAVVAPHFDLYGAWLYRTATLRHPKLITLAQAARLRARGIRNPYYAARAAHEAGIPLSLACALLTQETGGGANEWGHDPTIFVGGYDALHGVHYGEIVTHDAYLAYKAQRGPTGAGGMQGVGPCQLTYYSYQDEADACGGCWNPLANMLVGFKLLASNIKRDGLRAGIAAYNGSGPAAQRYADSVLALQARFKEVVA